MSNRNVRVNELIKREISDFLHTRLKGDAVRITITDVDVTPDHRNAKVYFSVLGDEVEIIESARFLRRHSRQIRGEIGRRIILKYLPKLEFCHDTSLERGDYMLRVLDELDSDEQPKD